MKIVKLVIIAMSIYVVSGCSYESNRQGPINIGDLNKHPVIGDLGLPLGTVTEIQAQIIAGREFRTKGDDGYYFLKVTHVAGNRLDNAPILRFSVFGVISTQLASNEFDLYELKHGKEANGLNTAQILVLEKDYVGKTVQLVVYEIGRFGGVPGNLPEDVITWADRGFHFSSSLVVLVEL